MVATTWGKMLVELPARLRGELLYQVRFARLAMLTWFSLARATAGSICC